MNFDSVFVPVAGSGNVGQLRVADVIFGRSDDCNIMTRFGVNAGQDVLLVSKTVDIECCQADVDYTHLARLAKKTSG